MTQMADGRDALRPCAIVVALFVLTLSMPARAMDPDRAVAQYLRETWGTERGFPGGQVEGIVQTADGHLWIGSNRGLIQFDGVTFRLVTDPAPNSPLIINVLGVSVDQNSDLLVRLQGPNVLLRPATGTFDNVLWPLRPRESAITAMHREKSGAVLMAGLTNGVMRYQHGRFEIIGPITALPQSPITAMVESGDGRILLGTRDQGLFLLDGRRVTHVEQRFAERPINSLLLVRQRDVWIGTDRGVLRWNGSEITSDGVPPVLRKVVAHAMLLDQEANLWVGTTDGLLRVNSNGVSSLLSSSQDGRDAVTALFQDKEGNLWVGGREKIGLLRNSRFVSYTQADGLPSDLSGPVYADSEGRTWFGPSTGGLYWLRGERVGKVSAAAFDEDIVYSIAGRDNELWIGRRRGGLTRLKLQPGTEVEVLSADTYSRRDGLADDAVYAVHASRDGTVWAGTLNGGLSHLQDGRFTAYTAADRLGAATVSSLLEASDGTMWVGTPNGLTSLSKNDRHRYNGPDLLPSDDVTCLFEDKDRTLWVGTANGLAVFAGGRLQPLSGVPSALNDQIVGLSEDRSGSLWISTLNRVLQVNAAKLRAGTLNELDALEYREYGVIDGLKSLEGIRRTRSVVSDEKGRIWFSTSGGLSVVDTEQPTVRSSVDPRVDAVFVDGSPVAATNDLHIPPGGRRIAVSYAGLSLAAPERVRFRYKLVGFDRDWSSPRTEREAVFTNLAPRAYEFQVMASNSEGLWNGSVATLRFEVDPALWQTWWFQFSSMLLAVAVATTIYRARTRQAARQLDIRFQERLAERTRIAQELHDTLLQGFISASMQLHVATNQLSPEGKRSMSGVVTMINQVIEEARSAVQGLRSGTEFANDNLEHAFGKIHEEFAGQGPEFRIVISGKPRAVHPIIRDEVYRIGREVLINALRHAAATTIEVEIDYAAHQLRLVVRDDGRGIDPNTMQSGSVTHRGLSGIRDRAERIGAKVALWSRKDAGTEVELTVPGMIAYQRLSKMKAALPTGSSSSRAPRGSSQTWPEH